MNCYLCERTLPFLPSWRALFLTEIPIVICDSCQNDFQRVQGTVCRFCGVAANDLCRECRHWETTEYAGMIHSGKNLYYYNESMKQYLHQFKFLQDVILAEVFAREVHEMLKNIKATIVPIPMHPEKLTERTFSQVDAMLEAANIPYSHFLTKSRQVQGKKTKQERISSADLFAWNGVRVPKKILLVDDIYTTGTTLRHAAKTLKEAGAEEISFFTLIRS